MADYFSAMPDSILCDGESCKINTDFRVWLKIGKLCRELKKPSVLAACLKAAYPVLPSSPAAAIRGMLWFLSCGSADTADSRSRENGGKDDGSMPQKAVYDAEEDSEYIWSAFMRQYGIDLSCAALHWWKFRALLGGLDRDCLFSEIVACRSMNTAEIADKELRRHYERLKKLYALPDRRTDEEREEELARCFENAF